MKKVITLLCVCSLFSSVSTTAFAENVVTNSEKITNTKEVYDIVSLFIKENYADDARIIYEEDGSVYINILEVPIGVDEEYQRKVADDISNYIDKNNIDPSMVPITFLTDAAVEEKIGDINSDGNVDLTDLSMLSLAIIGDKILTETQQKVADVTGDGQVSITDLATLRQYISMVIDSFR